jgi:hypothetical protein
LNVAPLVIAPEVVLCGALCSGLAGTRRGPCALGVFLRSLLLLF